MVRTSVLRGLALAALLGCSKDLPRGVPAAASPPTSSMLWDTADGGVLGIPQLALLSIVGKTPPPDGTYLADAIIVGAQVCHCPPGSQCDCPPDALNVTHDGADSASWSIRVGGGLYDLEARFKAGSRWHLTIRVDHGEPTIIDARPA